MLFVHTLSKTCNLLLLLLAPPAPQVGSWYNQFQAQYTAFTGGQTWTPGSNTGIYLNTQRAAQLWYHDHT